MATTALVLGGTGLVGGILLKDLLRDPVWSRVIAIARRPLGLVDARLTEVRADMTNLDAHRAALKADVVFCCLGTTLKKAGSQEAFREVDQTYVLRLARIAREQDARVFVLVSSLGADAASSNFYLRVKGETERDLQALGLPTLHILRPSLILGERSERRPLEALSQRLAPLASGLLIGPLRNYRAIRAEQVARAAMAVGADRRPGVHVHEGDALARF